MSDRITAQEYWAEIESLTKQVTEEARERGEDISDVLWETLDSHQWVIYTAYNFDVLAVSNNDGAYVSNFGSEGLVDAQGVLNTAAMAYCAMEQDVIDHPAFDADTAEEALEAAREGEA